MEFVKILLEHGADSNQRGYGLQVDPLTLAQERHCPEMKKLPLQHTARLSSPPRRDQGPDALLKKSIFFAQGGGTMMAS